MTGLVDDIIIIIMMYKFEHLFFFKICFRFGIGQNFVTTTMCSSCFTLVYTFFSAIYQNKTSSLYLIDVMLLLHILIFIYLYKAVDLQKAGMFVLARLHCKYVIQLNMKFKFVTLNWCYLYSISLYLHY